MHETTRRFCCRAGFLLGCVLPTLLVLAWIGYLRSPTYREQQRLAWQESLALHLGMEVTVERVSRPEPNLVALDGVRLMDPETGSLLASTPRLECARQEHGWVVYAAEAETPRAQLARLVEIAHATLWRRSTRGVPVWQVVLGSLLVSSESDPHTLLDVQFSGQSSEAGQSSDAVATNPRVQIEFRVAGTDMSQPARITITRNRQTEPPTTAWAFHTGPQALPSTLVALAWPDLLELGEAAFVSGQLVMRESARGWSGEAQGRLTQVDLDRLVTGRFPHKLSGTAELVLSRVEWENGRLVDVAGTITSGGGVVSQSLLVAAAEENTLQWVLAPRVAESRQTLWKYRELAFGFQLNHQGVQIAGQCEGRDSGAILTDSQGTLASEGSQPWLSAVAVVRSLAPQSEIQVPASASTERLLRHLPLPPVVAPTGGVARPGYSPLRLR